MDSSLKRSGLDWAPEEVIEAAAEICHEANRSWQKIVGDAVSPPWAEASDHQKNSARAGAKMQLSSAARVPGDAAHDSWMEAKLRDGWRYGPEKDEVAKTHPCLLPYGSLPPSQQFKDDLFGGVCSAFKHGFPHKTMIAVGRAAVAARKPEATIPVSSAGDEEEADV